jgi:hypothetical protein
MATVINININGYGVSQTTEPSPDPYRVYHLLPGFSPVREMFGERKIKAKKKKNCSNGQVCGFSCISKTKVCTSNMTTAQLKEHNAAKRLAAADKKAAAKGGASGVAHKPIDAPDKFSENAKVMSRVLRQIIDPTNDQLPDIDSLEKAFDDIERKSQTLKTLEENSLFNLQVIQEFGYSEKPKVLDDAEFAAFAKENQSLYFRGVRDNLQTGVSGKDVQDQLRDSDYFYFPGGAYGDGLYMASAGWGEEGKNSATVKYAVEAGRGYGENVIAMSMSKSAKMANSGDANAIADQVLGAVTGWGNTKAQQEIDATHPRNALSESVRSKNKSEAVALEQSTAKAIKNVNVKPGLSLSDYEFTKNFSVSASLQKENGKTGRVNVDVTTERNPKTGRLDFAYKDANGILHFANAKSIDGDPPQSFVQSAVVSTAATKNTIGSSLHSGWVAHTVHPNAPSIVEKSKERAESVQERLRSGRGGDSGHTMQNILIPLGYSGVNLEDTGNYSILYNRGDIAVRKRNIDINNLLSDALSIGVQND